MSDAGSPVATPRRNRPGRLFAHSPLDACLVLVTAATLGLTAWGAANFSRLSWPALGAYAVTSVLLSVTNYNTAVHNFTHNPFFAVRPLNALYSALAAITAVTSVTSLALYHVEHHRFGNDRRDPVTRTTQDSISTYLYGRDGGHESLWRYSFLSPLRDWLALPEEYRFVKAQPRRAQIWAENAVLGAFWLGLFAVDWRFALFYLPVTYLGLAGTSAQNYFEHYAARPGSRRTDAVSCYNPIYNFLWFNNGYHQEHHYRSGVHWTRVKELRQELPPEDQRRVVKWAHLTNYRWLASLGTRS